MKRKHSLKSNQTILRHLPNEKPGDGISRRLFLKRAAGAAALLGFPTIIPARALGKDGTTPPSERVRIGIIGCGQRSLFARAYMANPSSQIVALADPWDKAIDDWLAFPNIDPGTRRTRDFRELLEGDVVDAVHISTGDYWHVPALLLAARAGKHAYVEKPLGLTISQDLACREIPAEHPDVKVQYGTQQRAMVNSRGTVELALNGHIGEVKEAYLWCVNGISGGVCEPEPPPANIDYQMWLGPAPEAPYCKERVEKKGNGNAIFHVYDYAIGFVAGWGAHPYDTFQWWLDESGIGMPRQVEATGSIPTEGFRNTVTQWDAKITYDGGLNVRFCDFQTIPKYLPKLDGLNPEHNGVLLIGSKGWLHTSRNIWEASSREILLKSKDPGEKRVVNAGPTQIGNFIDAILGKNKIVSPLESATRSDICCHLTDLAIRHGGNLGWDAAANMITGNDAAKAAMHREMRKPWNVLNPKYMS